ncbi:MAG: tRNA lysidine(34) synthetase TilS [Pseudomonadota bacterium]
MSVKTWGVPKISRKLSSLENIAFSEFEKLFSPKTTAFAVAVSGGADSIALLYLLKSWQEHFNTPSNPTNKKIILRSAPEIHILTVDHGLRKGSEKEAQFVKDIALKMSFIHQTLFWSEPKPETGIQQAARNARYNLMTSYCHQHDIPCLLLAHHQDDQVETVLMRLQRGSGLDGLCGMHPSSSRTGIKIFRPLLSVCKQNLITFLKEREISWCEDPSNANDAFERVRIRQTRKHFEDIGINTQTIALSASRLQRVWQTLENQLDKIWPSLVSIQDAGFAVMQKTQFLELDDELAIRSLKRLLECIGRRETMPQLVKLENVLNQIRRNANSSESVSLSGCIITSTREIYTISRELRSTENLEISLKPGQVDVWDRRFKVRISPKLKCPICVKPLTEEGYKQHFQELKKLNHSILETYPKYVRQSLLSFWQQEKLLSIPHLGYISPSLEGKFDISDFQAHFFSDM